MSMCIFLQYGSNSGTYLDHSVPASTNNDGVIVRWRESHARDPVSVGIRLVNRVLALSQRVPQLDRLVAGATHDLTIVWRESHREDIVGMSFEATSSLAHIEIPQTQSLIPRARKGVVAVLGQDNVGDEVTVATQALQGVSVIGFIVIQLPHDEGFVAGRRQNGIGELTVGGDLSDPVRVTDQGSLENQLFRLTHSHFECFWSFQVGWRSRDLEASCRRRKLERKGG